MKTVNIHEAKTHLSKLVGMAVTQRQAFVIAKAGRPLVKVTPIDQADAPRPRIGFMRGRMAPPPADFDALSQKEIEALFQHPE